MKKCAHRWLQISSSAIRHMLRITSIHLFLGLSALACSNGEFVAERPNSVPETAHLVGGIDGWNWVDCKPSSAEHLQCKIFDSSGVHIQTSYLRPCFNVRPEYRNDSLMATHIKEASIVFGDVYLFEYKPSIILNRENGSFIAEKYYELLGVDDNCSPVGPDSELVPVGQ